MMRSSLGIVAVFVLSAAMTNGDGQAVAPSEVCRTKFLEAFPAPGPQFPELRQEIRIVWCRFEPDNRHRWLRVESRLVYTLHVKEGGSHDVTLRDWKALVYESLGCDTSFDADRGEGR